LQRGTFFLAAAKKQDIAEHIFQAATPFFHQAGQKYFSAGLQHAYSGRKQELLPRNSIAAGHIFPGNGEKNGHSGAFF
jgi:hypothetical protein